MSEYLRFIAKIDRGPDCWVWRGKRIRKGYGHFRRSSGQLVYAHRYAYEVWVAPIPAGKHIDHVCNNPSCVNPDHLQLVTAIKNNALARLRKKLS